MMGRRSVPAGDVVAIVPARLGSTRLPGKVLLSETGMPLVVHAARAALGASRVGRVVVATDEARVAEACGSWGVEAVMTSPRHENGTSRLAEAVGLLGLSADAVVVNVQGDEPEVEGSTIDAAVGALAAGGVEMGTAAAPIGSAAEVVDPSVVKVVCSLGGRALYFSRSAIPHHRDAAGGDVAGGVLRHAGLYAYTAGFVVRYASMEPTPLERAERLEQLRVLEHGGSIGVAMVERGPAGIDTAAQYAAFVARWRGGPGDAGAAG